MRAVTCALLLCLGACSPDPTWRSPPSPERVREDYIGNPWARTKSGRLFQEEDFDVAYENFGFPGGSYTPMLYFNEKLRYNGIGERRSYDQPILSFSPYETCKYGDIVCVMNDDMPIVISTDFEQAARRLADAGFDLSDISPEGIPHCRAYRIKKRDAEPGSRPMEYIFCRDVGVTRIDSDIHAQRSGLQLRSALGLGGRRVNKVFDHPKSGAK